MEWLIGHGARHILLLGRREADTALKSRIADLAESKVEVLTCSVDVTDFHDLNSTVTEAMKSLPPLRGAFHLAGILDDAVLMQQDAAHMERVIAPKLAGAWNLHHLMKNYDHDIFVCFSSISGLTGSMGQANYAAANAAMDALVAWRHAQGLPGLSLQWGPWADQGMAASLAEQDQQRLAGYGIGSIMPDEAMTLLNRLLTMKNSTDDLTAEPHILAVMQVQWETFLNNIYGTKIPLLYSELAVQPSSSISTEAAPDLKNKLKTLPPDEAELLLEQHVRELVAEALGISSPQRIGLRQRLFDLGLDSLGAVELKNRLAASIGSNLRQTLLFDFPTLTTLMDHLKHDVLEITADDEPSTPETILTESLEGLSEDALAELLAEELNT